MRAKAIMLGLLSGAFLAGGLLSCATERVVRSGGRPLPPAPRAAREVPPGVRPSRMVLLQGQKAVDTDGNGYPDRIEVVCSLFADGYNSSMEWEGAFAFTLHRMGAAQRPGAAPIGEWRFEPEAVAAARATAGYGPCYRFTLSLAEAGGERLPPQHGDLRGRFEPADGGPPIRASDQVRPVQIGHAARAPGGRAAARE